MTDAPASPDAAGAVQGRPALVRHVRLRHDVARDRWVIQAPERVFALDPIAHAVVEACDGERTLVDVIDHLAAKFGAPRDRVAADVTAMVEDLCAKGVMRP